MRSEKIFIISLPRTGTTSACLFFLDAGLKVAHTAFSQDVFQQADVIADTPVFVDYGMLDEVYPNSKFIYLSRPIDLWIASIRRLLKSMRKKLVNNANAFDKEIVRCFQLAFPDFDSYKYHTDDYLVTCLRQHRVNIDMYFHGKTERILIADITEDHVDQKLSDFCTGFDLELGGASFPRVNIGRKITYWESVRHENKVESR